MIRRTSNTVEKYIGDHERWLAKCELPRAQGPWLRVSQTQLGKSLSALARGRRLNSFLF
jgi:hypothetical protein